jgi:hypothetical protein
MSREVIVTTIDDMQELRVDLPDMGDDEDVPDAAMFILACACRWKTDKTFVKEMLSWFNWEIAVRQLSKKSVRH